MKKILKLRWFIFSIWITATVLLTVFQPDINAILRLRGQGSLSDNNPSKIAASLLSKMSHSNGKDDLIVFYDKNKLSTDKMKQIESGMNAIRNSQSKLGVDNIIDPFSKPDAKNSLISKDKTTLMISFKLDKKGREIDDIKKEFENKLKAVKVTYYLTGEDFINNDYLKATEAGVEKSAAITVVFIMIILILMFRSIVTPLVSLLAVGVSYLCSMGIAAQLIDKANFPITSLTQMLLILILFGIGTDYNILLFNRFKEELSHGYNVDEAILNTYKTAGKTIVYSILTVFIAFLSLTFANYGIYQSGNVVAIGAIILLLEIMTLTPSIMKQIGTKLFWPSRNINGHKDSKFWEKLTSISVKHPIILTAVILVSVVPIILFNNQKISFDTLKELGNSYTSSKGFNLVAEHFGRGQALPTTIVIKNNKPLDNNDSLSAIDEITENIKKIKGVKKVLSVTQPLGTQINQFYISSQTKMVTNGIFATRSGVNKIHDGLSKIENSLSAPDFSSVNELVSGTGKLNNGLGSITDGLKKISSGIDQGAGGAAKLSDGIGKIKYGLDTVSKNTTALYNGLSQMQNGYSKLYDGYNSIEQNMSSVQSGLTVMNWLINSLENANTNQELAKIIAKDPRYSVLKNISSKLTNGFAQLNGGLQELNKNNAKITGSLKKANEGLKQLAAAQAQMVNGLGELQRGLTALSSGLSKGSAGQNTIINNMSKLRAGLEKVNNGQKALYSGLSNAIF